MYKDINLLDCLKHKDKNKMSQESYSNQKKDPLKQLLQKEK